MITMDKKYRYRNGGDARILCVDRNDSYFTIVSISNGGVLNTHTKDGFLFANKEKNELDLIEVVPLWRGEVWVHPDGRVREIANLTTDEANRWGWRKITAVEERSES